jgi:hypothetical protein
MQGIVDLLALWAHTTHLNVLPLYGVFQGVNEIPQLCLVSPCMRNGNLRDYASRLSQKSRLPLVCRASLLRFF